MYWVYDLEVFPNCFQFSIISADMKTKRGFEVSEFRNDLRTLLVCLSWLKEKGQILVGFNNLQFDYPVVHKIIENRKSLLAMTGKQVAAAIWKYAQEQIESGKTGFPVRVKEEDCHIKQLDLFFIHHFNNKAKSTSLKLLQFNMRSDTIEDLPYEIGQVLTKEECEKLLEYNFHDVIKTLDFFNISSPMVEFRRQLTEKFGKDMTNHNDTKIGKDYFIMRLEESGIPTRRRVGSRSELIQSPRPIIRIADCLFDYYDFQTPEFNAVLDWFKRQRIVETKGVFTELDEYDLGSLFQYANTRVRKIRIKCQSNDGPSTEELAPFIKKHPKGWVEKIELKATVPRTGGVKKNSYWFNWAEADVLNVVVNGFQFDFGTGGIHGSILETVFYSDGDWIIKDADVSSMYPNIAISNRVYPEHLTEMFCDIYTDVYEQRKAYPKGSSENAMLKLALNGVYGDSNNKYSPFYDPMYTMKITVNGQLSLCLLAEKLMLGVPEIQIIQINTDGITVRMKREHEHLYNAICAQWQKQVKLELEFALYSKMIIRDVNNYIAIYENGKVKRKGAYQYEGLGWHQNQSSLVIQKAAEAHMLHGISIREFVENHKDKFDFMLRAKIPRSSKLYLENPDGSMVLQQNVCRYYASKTGGFLWKIMPPLLKKPEAERKIGICRNQLVRTCNNMVDFRWDIDYDYYVDETEKLIVGKKTNYEIETGESLDESIDNADS